jgi:hypothetical protein
LLAALQAVKVPVARLGLRKHVTAKTPPLLF